MEKRHWNNDTFRGVVQLIAAAISGGAISWIVNRLDTRPLQITIPVVVLIVSLIPQVYLIKKATQKAEEEKKKAKEAASQQEQMTKLQIKLAKFDEISTMVEDQKHTILAYEKKCNELDDVQVFLSTELAFSSSILSSLGNMFFKNADALAEIAKEIATHGNYNEKLWNFQKNCDILCESILLCVKKVALYGENFSVGYIACYDSLRGSLSSTPRSSAYMIGYADTYGGRPTIYYPQKIPRRYCSKKAFVNRPHDPIIFKNKNEIAKNFLLRHPDRCKYSQYIGIPVFCSDGKMAGLIEVIALRDSQIAEETTSDLSNIAETYLKPYAHLFLLMDKMEEAMLASPPHKLTKADLTEGG